MYNYMNPAQKVFGLSTTNAYIFVGVFLAFVVLLIVLQIMLKKVNKKLITYLPFLAMILSIIIVLPFQAKVNYAPWATQTNFSLWYLQIMQFAICFGNIYMIFLVLFLISALFFNILRTTYDLVCFKQYKKFFKHLLVFVLACIFMLALINLYRVFPMYDYDMNNNPTYSFVSGTVGINTNSLISPYGINNLTFSGQGYWPFFLTNFLIFYFFTGNFDFNANVNAHYLTNINAYNQALPIQIVIVLALFSFAFVLGLFIGWIKPNNVRFIKWSEKTKKINNKLLSYVTACLSVASLSFFSESLLQSQIGTWLHISFVFVIMLIAWVTFYLVSFTLVTTTYKLSPKRYLKEIIAYIHQAFKKNSLNDNEFINAQKIINNNLHKEQGFLSLKTIDQDYKKITFISEVVIFPIALIGYLSFLPLNGYLSTSNVNNIAYWIAMFFGSFYCFVGSYGIFGLATCAQNMQASCAFNVMCGTNTGIFGPFGFIMNKFRIEINLNFLFAFFAVQERKELYLKKHDKYQAICITD